MRIARLEARIAEARHELREEIRVGLKDVEAKIDRRFADLIKWSFLFWCGAVAAAIFARV